MKKVFVSMPMRGKGKEEIVKEQDRVLKLALGVLGIEGELAKSYLGEGHVNHTPLENMGESLKRMSGVDLVVFAKGWENARGCRIEHSCAIAFGVPFVEEDSLWGIEDLARILHEAGREAVEKGNTVAAGKFGDPSRKFLEWGEISESAREGRRIQARYLLERFVISEKREGMA